MPLTLLITGFGPFPGAPFNPTGALVRGLVRLRRPLLADARLVPHIFRTGYAAVDKDLPRLLADVRPDAVLMFGLANRTKTLRVETQARNAVTALISDHEGRQRPSPRIVPGGPRVLPFRIPAARLAAAARKAGIPTTVSHDAGRYLCNYLSWRVIETLARQDGPAFAAFIHVPPFDKNGWRAADLLTGAEAILLSAVAETRRRTHMKQR